MSGVKRYTPKQTATKLVLLGGAFEQGTEDYNEMAANLSAMVGDRTDLTPKESLPEVGWGFDGKYFHLVMFGSSCQLTEDCALMFNGNNPEVISRTMLEHQYVERVEDPTFQVLNHMFDLQRDVESAWGRLPDPNNPEHVSQYIREVILCATDELHEVLAEVNWKPWKKSSGIKDMAKYREELADVMHFILDLYLAAGLSGETLYRDYVAKHNTNIDRVSSQEYVEG